MRWRTVPGSVIRIKRLWLWPNLIIHRQSVLPGVKYFRIRRARHWPIPVHAVPTSKNSARGERCDSPVCSFSNQTSSLTVPTDGRITFFLSLSLSRNKLLRNPEPSACAATSNQPKLKPRTDYSQDILRSFRCLFLPRSSVMRMRLC